MSTSQFTKKLIAWHIHINDRELPWKQESDPYKIWLSEIILQQTRAAQGLPFYLKFIETYPTVKDLANADDQEVFKLWQGLGYYSRCRNLLKSARMIRDNYKGEFPQTYDAIIQLPGVGPYTAAAIASFAYNLPYPVVDGNVYRILARYFNIRTPIDHSSARKAFTQIAAVQMKAAEPAAFNQAMMDFGATVCKPAAPLCITCPLSEGCYAYKHDLISSLPVKVKRLEKRHRYFVYAILQYEEEMYFELRTEKDIWQGLYQPFLIEWEAVPEINKAQKLLSKLFNNNTVEYMEQHRQVLTHQYIHSYWFTIKLDKLHNSVLEKGAFYSLNKLKNLPLPKTIFSVMSKNNYF